MLQLFDELAEADEGPAGYGESAFEYWNRSGRDDIRQVKAHIEQWFQHYPDAHKSELRARFRSADNAQHRGAFFELFLHELLRHLGCAVDVHPEVAGTTKRPEFLVSFPDGVQFYLEAKLATDESKEEVAAAKRKNIVYDALNELDSPDYWINVEVSGAPASPVPTKRLKKFLADKLGTLAYDELKAKFEENGLDALPRWQYEFEGWNLSFFPIPKLKFTGHIGIRPLGMQFYGVQWIQPEVAVRKAILEKAKRYGSPDLPFVIAINALGENIQDEFVVEALFGNETFVSRFPGDQFHLVRQPNGVFTSPGGQYTRVSAVLVFQELHLHNYPTANVRLYLHPTPAKPLLGPLLRLPRAVVSANRLQLLEGDDVGKLLGVSYEWLDHRQPN